MSARKVAGMRGLSRQKAEERLVKNSGGGAAFGQKFKGVQNLSVQDASAALPQNCQTTIRIVGSKRWGVNVTSVIAAMPTSNQSTVPIVTAGLVHELAIAFKTNEKDPSEIGMEKDVVENVITNCGVSTDRR
jgi:hypothetical protein